MEPGNPFSAKDKYSRSDPNENIQEVHVLPKYEHVKLETDQRSRHSSSGNFYLRDHPFG